MIVSFVTKSENLPWNYPIEDFKQFHYDYLLVPITYLSSLFSITDNYNLIVSEYKIPIIENLGATLDQFDTINFTNNEIRKIDNFPLLPRLKSLIFNNNRIV